MATVRDKETSKLEHHAGSKSRALGERSHKQGSGKFNWGHVPDRVEDAESGEQEVDKEDPMYDSDIPQQERNSRETRRDKRKESEVAFPE
ncbi:UNVERIFIED_CONTAM: hypothetical protein HHA_314310 [Hammondia hammondi]|eukprot:XP_008883500.1 hypothetical protein HHA_314310 [Hammondia hammondi]